MKYKKWTLIVLFPFLLSAIGYMSTEEAENMARRLYEKIEHVVEIRKDDTKLEDFQEIYGIDKNGKYCYKGMPYTNDLYLLGADDVAPEAIPSRYFVDLVNYSKQHNAHLKCTFQKGELCRDASGLGNRYLCYYRKKWEVDDKIYIVDEIVSINLQYKCIALIESKLSNDNAVIAKKPSTKNSKKKTEPDSFISNPSPSPTMNEEAMLAKASLLFHQRLYTEAATLLGIITQVYPNSDEAWCQYGYMWYKDLGMGRTHTREERYKAAKACWSRSNLPRAKDAITLITDGRE